VCAASPSPRTSNPNTSRQEGQYETTVPTITDRVVQAALKLVLEPIFEADFLPVSYGFRPRRRAHDAIAEIQRYGTKGYRWVLDADIEACFDSISHPALLDRVRGQGQGQACARAGQGVPQGRDPHRARPPAGHPDRHAAGRHPHSTNAMGNFCFEVTLGYQRVERPRRGADHE
jgi:hypothetical protein